MYAYKHFLNWNSGDQLRRNCKIKVGAGIHIAAACVVLK